MRYGEEFVLVDDYGMSWNHSAGGMTNYLGFKKVGMPGELCLTFRKRGAPQGEGTHAGDGTEKHSSPLVMPSPRNGVRKRGGSASPHPGSRSPNRFQGGSKGIRRIVNTGNPPVKFYTDHVELIVTRSLRMNKKIGNPISNFKRGSSRVLGGYLTCEKVGFPLDFKIHRAPPSILTATTFSYHDSMRMHSFHNINWGEEIELTVPLDVNLVATQPVLSVTLSNGQYAMFNQSEILKQPGKAFWVDVMGAPMGEPSRLLCQFDCFSGNDKLSSLSIVKSNRRFFLVTWASAFIVFLSALGGFFVSRNKFVYVNPAYDSGLSAGNEGVWSYYTSGIISNDSISRIEGGERREGREGAHAVRYCETVNSSAHTLIPFSLRHWRSLRRREVPLVNHFHRDILRDWRHH